MCRRGGASAAAAIREDGLQAFIHDLPLGTHRLHREVGKGARHDRDHVDKPAFTCCVFVTYSSSRTDSGAEGVCILNGHELTIT